MPIEEHCDRFGAGERDLFVRTTHQFRNGRERKIFSAGNFVTAPNSIGVAGVNGLSRIDRSSQCQIGKKTVVIWISSGGEPSTVYISGGGINGMMVLEPNALMREFIECWRVSLSYKVRAHSIPNDQHDVTRFAASRRGHGERTASEGQQRSPGPW